MRKIGMLLGSWCVYLCFVAWPGFAQMYTVTDLGTLGGTISVATAINNRGQVVGWSYTGATDPVAGNITHAFRTQPNRPINPATDDLGTLGGFYSWAYGINKWGQVAGSSYTGTCCTEHGFRTEPDHPINPATDDLGTLGGDSSLAFAINDRGQVVGASDNGVATCPSPHGPYPAQHAFRTTPNQSINPFTDDLGTYDGCWSAAFGINNRGEVVGEDQGTDTLHAFRTRPDAPIDGATDDLGSLGGPTIAYGINNLGQVVGTDGAGPSCCTSQLFRTAPGLALNPANDNLGTVNQAIWPADQSPDDPSVGINRFGQVVGGAPAVIYGAGSLHNLNDLIPANSGWNLIMAYGINDEGQIVGMGATGGASGYGVGRAYLLNPIYRAIALPPLQQEGRITLPAAGEVIPVRFALIRFDYPSCALLPATIALTRIAGEPLGSIDPSTFLSNASSTTSFRADFRACQYHYNLDTALLGEGAYRVDIAINGVIVGHATFALSDRPGF